jgi:sulfotransferase famil protein
VSELLRVLVLPVRRGIGALKLPVLVANPFATRRLPLHAPDFPLVLLYSPKAGSGALTKWFLFQTGHLEEIGNTDRGMHRLLRSMQSRRPGYGWEALRLVVFRDKPIFKLVRNPYDRAVSAFLAVVFHSDDAQLNPWGRKPMAAARKHSGKPAMGEPALSFRDFLRFLAWNGTASGEVNGHLARQHLAGEDGRIDRIIKLERFVEEIRQIESEYGLARSPFELIGRPHNERKRLREEPNYTGCAADLEITPAQVRQESFPAYEAFYDDETRRLVRECFAADFEAYGYDTLAKRAPESADRLERKKPAVPGIHHILG